MIRLSLYIAIIFFYSTALASPDYKAKVIAITDGDTIKVLRGGNEQVKIRFAGIDCPERKQPWGTKAKQATSDFVAGQTVTIKVMGIDRYKRTVGRVFVDGVNVNRELVRGGHCWTYVKYAKDTELFTLQEEASSQGRGLWRLPESERVPPWEWRKAKRKK